MATDGRMTIRLSKKLQVTLARLAKQRDETESEVVRHAIEKLAEADSKSPSVLDLLKKTKAIGIVKNAPPDLSTNPEYLEDFGRD